MPPELVKTIVLGLFAALVIGAAVGTSRASPSPTGSRSPSRLAFAPAALLVGVPLPEIGVSLAVGVGMLVVGAGMFALGWIGGGDAKLMAAAALWVGLRGLAPFAIYTALAGGAAGAGAGRPALGLAATARRGRTGLDATPRDPRRSGPIRRRHRGRRARRVRRPSAGLRAFTATLGLRRALTMGPPTLAARQKGRFDSRWTVGPSGRTGLPKTHPSPRRRAAIMTPARIADHRRRACRVGGTGALRARHVRPAESPAARGRRRAARPADDPGAGRQGRPCRRRPADARQHDLAELAGGHRQPVLHHRRRGRRAESPTVAVAAMHTATTHGHRHDHRRRPEAAGDGRRDRSRADLRRRADHLQQDRPQRRHQLHGRAPAGRHARHRRCRSASRAPPAASSSQATASTSCRPTRTPPRPARGGMVTETVLANALVLAIDQHTDAPKDGASMIGATVTLEVPDHQRHLGRPGPHPGRPDAGAALLRRHRRPHRRPASTTATPSASSGAARPPKW